jgi:nicotinate phosphoribosyltransferase
VRVAGVRLDSGDLAALSKSVRAIFDAGGLGETRIFASGNLDEYRVRDLVAAGAPIDGFGLGTSLVTAADAPSLDAVYKLQEYAGKPRRKRSASKWTWPGRKQVYRTYDERGRLREDVLTLENDALAGEPLLTPVMRGGKRITAPETLDAIRARATTQLERVPEALRTLDPAAPPYTVRISPALEALAREADALSR